MMTGAWLLIRGGLCRYGDAARLVQVPALRWTTTPVTCRYLGEHGPDADTPLTGVSYGQAAALAAALGGRLPRSAEWEWMAAGAVRRRYPWGDADWHPGRAVLLPSGMPGPVPAGSLPDGATPDGMLDVAGNVWEWTASAVMGDGRIIRGGSYASQPAYARTTFINAVPAELRSPGLGFRVVREP
jgi:formylglycine-generating enzyme